MDNRYSILETYRLVAHVVLRHIKLRCRTGSHRVGNSTGPVRGASPMQLNRGLLPISWRDCRLYDENSAQRSIQTQLLSLYPISHNSCKVPLQTASFHKLKSCPFGCEIKHKINFKDASSEGEAQHTCCQHTQFLFYFMYFCLAILTNKQSTYSPLVSSSSQARTQSY